MNATLLRVVRELVKWARRIGRWLTRRLARRGPVKLIGSLEIRIDELEEARARARKRKAYRSKRWARRIGWRKRLLAWLIKRQDRITGTVIKAGDEAIDALSRRIPMYTREAQE